MPRGRKRKVVEPDEEKVVKKSVTPKIKTENSYSLYSTKDGWIDIFNDWAGYTYHQGESISSDRLEEVKRKAKNFNIRVANGPTIQIKTHKVIVK